MDAKNRDSGEQLHLRAFLVEDEALISSEDLLNHAAGNSSGAEARHVEEALRQRDDLRVAFEAACELVSSSLAEDADRVPSSRSRSRFSNGTIVRFTRSRVLVPAFAVVLLAALAVLGLWRDRESTSATAVVGFQDRLASLEGSWANPRGPLRSAQANLPTLELLAPRGRTRGSRPEIVWCALAGSTEFRVEVRRDDGSLVFERRTSSCRLEWPADVKALEAGEQYQVLVEVIRGVRHSTDRWFTVLGREQRQQFDSDVRDLPLAQQARWLASLGARSDAAATLEPWLLTLDDAQRAEALDVLRQNSATDIARDLELRLWVRRTR